MRLPLAHQALARAQRMIDDLGQHVKDEVAFRDRLPYVLDLLAGVTRCVDSGSKGSRTQQFADWWSTTDRTMQTSIQELRNAELKRVESRSQPQVKVEMIPPDPQPVSSGDLHELIASQFSIVVSTEWRFIGGDLDGKPILPALVQYWNDLSGILAKAEVLLGP